MARRRNRQWPRYVSVAEHRESAARKAKALAKQGEQLQSVTAAARSIASTFWGKAWCKHLEKFSDYSNRLPRGRSYVRNGSVIHLEIRAGEIVALVGGSSVYRISISISPLPKTRWEALKASCAGSISSALELLQGDISSNTMQAVCDRDSGLFPSPKEIQLSCDCPDWAVMCKHLAAVLYGVGVRLDESPELLFVLRGVDYQELIGAELAIEMTATESELTENLSDIFGVEIDESVDLESVLVPRKTVFKKKKRPLSKKSSSKKKVAYRAGSKKKLAYKKVPKRKIRGDAQVAQGEINISRGIRASHINKLLRVQQLSVKDLATLTNKSVATVKAWQSRSGVLTLQSDSKKSLEKVFSMTSKQIHRRLNK